MRNEREGRRLPSWAIGLVLVVVIAVASVLAFTKELPWGDKFEVRPSSARPRTCGRDSPVRIAGVEVGKVTVGRAARRGRRRHAYGAGRRRASRRRMPHPASRPPW